MLTRVRKVDNIFSVVKFITDSEIHIGCMFIQKVVDIFQQLVIIY
ncbi:hypothetical protein HMPREF0530_1547, partial [Lacticaseibacillus paracasei subsp. paracasei ATCC 25302 = DSM 5622 = JCM 8130]